MDKPTQWIIHLDLDAFYASVEVLDNPQLKGQAVIVGGLGPRGVVSTCSYEARALGVHSGMPISQARRLCPKGVYIQVRMKRYKEFSQKVMDIFARYTPLIEPLSLDEAFLDVTGSIKLFGLAPMIARRIKDEVSSEVGLTISAGVSTVKHIAKIASGLNKPDALNVVAHGQETAFLNPLDIGKLWGVGKVTEKILRQMGISTIGDLAQLSEKRLFDKLGESGSKLWRLANCIDPREVQPTREAKSIGAEETYPQDIRPGEAVDRELLSLAFKVAGRLRQSGLSASTISLKVRDSNFKTYNRSKTVNKGISEHNELYDLARSLFPTEKKGPFRLLGISASNLLSDDEKPPDLFGSAGLSRSKVDPRLTKAMDAINNRFGENILKPATLLSKPPTKPHDGDK
ncbi:MAG: DNA polymerase IV [Deltaproteobacteria bacterium]|jgi:DNA polymerase-4|nr:DNA polymerase IV [Deltaproteobacteria bacterium]